MFKLLSISCLFLMVSTSWAGELPGPLAERYGALAEMFEEGSPISIIEVHETSPKFKFMRKVGESDHYHQLDNFLNNADISIKKISLGEQQYIVKMKFKVEKDPVGRPYSTMSFKGMNRFITEYARVSSFNVYNKGYLSVLPPWFYKSVKLTFRRADYKGTSYVLVEFGPNILGYEKIK